MPELPEVETAMRGLRARLAGRQITSFVQRRPDLRFPLPKGLSHSLIGARVEGFERRGKYIIVKLGDRGALMLHLGMSGRLLFDGPDGGPHEHLTFGFDDGTMLRFVDPRRFGMLDLVRAADLPSHPRLVGLGLEPLDPSFGRDRLSAVLARRKSALKIALMNQRLVVGVGNIYACESLFASGLSPVRPAGALTLDELGRLADSIRQVLVEAIAAGGSSLRDYVQTNGELGYFQHRFQVYDRFDQPCVRCRQPIRRIVLANRATYFCDHCQR